MGKHLPQIIELLKKEKPDIVALQEVVRITGEKENTAEILAGKLDYHWRFAPVPLPFPDRNIAEWGEGILSRYDIETSEIIRLSENPEHIGLMANITINHRILHVISTHLTHTHQVPSEHQESEARSLVRLSPKSGTVIMGDFNALPESKTVSIMRGAFVDADSANQPTWCVYPDGCRVCRLSEVKYRLDYMFTTGDLKAEAYRTISSDGSDHLPIAATI